MAQDRGGQQTKRKPPKREVSAKKLSVVDTFVKAAPGVGGRAVQTSHAQKPGHSPMLIRPHKLEKLNPPNPTILEDIPEHIDGTGPGRHKW